MRPVYSCSTHCTRGAFAPVRIHSGSVLLCTFGVRCPVHSSKFVTGADRRCPEMSPCRPPLAPATLDPDSYSSTRRLVRFRPGQPRTFPTEHRTAAPLLPSKRASGSCRGEACLAWPRPIARLAIRRCALLRGTPRPAGRGAGGEAPHPIGKQKITHAHRKAAKNGKRPRRPPEQAATAWHRVDRPHMRLAVHVGSG